MKKTQGFTVVELLIVIVVLGILMTIGLIAYRGMQDRSLDSRREQDMASIKKALLLYNTKYGGVPTTFSAPRYNPQTGVTGRGGWDSSTDADWLVFLRNDYGTMPVDPLNTLSDGVSPVASNSRAYFYYCYPNGTPAPVSPASPHVRMGYRKQDNTRIFIDFAVASCL